jgi:hypothetical protein
MSKDKKVDPSLADTLKVSTGILVYFSLLVITKASKKIKHWDIPYASFTRSPFARSEFSMAFPYVAMADDDKLESSLLSGFVENCDSDFQGNHITYTDTCTVSGEDL